MAALANVTVLILDDNPLVLKLGRALLEREGCTVLTASSWIEFNHVLAEQHAGHHLPRREPAQHQGQPPQ
jgi:CheY-like chemotaxis protein